LHVLSNSVTFWNAPPPLGDRVLEIVADVRLAGDTPTEDVLSLAVSDLLYDPFRAELLASTLPSDANYPNRILRVDPANGRLSTMLDPGSEPRKLALSDDGRYVYVAANIADIFRWDRQREVIDLRFPAQAGEISDIAVAPGRPEFVAVGTVWSSSVALFEEGVRLPDWLELPGLGVPYRVAFADSARACGVGAAGFSPRGLADGVHGPHTPGGNAPLLSPAPVAVEDATEGTEEPRSGRHSAGGLPVAGVRFPDELDPLPRGAALATLRGHAHVFGPDQELRRTDALR
jgi:hypothetical protein